MLASLSPGVYAARYRVGSVSAKRRESGYFVPIAQRKLGIKTIYDLSATPFFLRGSGYSEGTLFSWVVSDFSLIDAIECGIVKVPRVPVSDNAMDAELPTYRNIWYRIRDDLPKKGRGTEDYGGEPKLPAVLEGALQSLYENYEKCFRRWEKNAEARASGLGELCTEISKMLSGLRRSLRSGD